MSKSFPKKTPHSQQGPLDRPAADQMTQVRLEQRIVRLGAPPPVVNHIISEDELLSLTHGAPDSWYFTVGISMISMALTLGFSLLTATLSYGLFMVFLALVALLFGFGSPFIIIWTKARGSSGKTADTIRKRQGIEICD